MSKELVISATQHETRVAVMEDGQLCEIYIEREKEFALVGSLYKGRVTRVLPGMQSAFVDIGLDSDAFLYVSDFLEHLEEYDHVAPAEPKPQRNAPQAKPSEVYPPTTTNGGVVPPPAEAPETFAAAAVEPAAADEPAEALPVITPLEGETIQALAAPSGASEGGARPGAPMQRTQHPPFEPRRDGGGRGGFGNRGGQGGRGRRFGRPGQGRGGHDRRPQGRDLPPSKYASPSESRPRESQPYEPPAASDFEPIILPGESLSKFKDRAPSAGSAHSAEFSSLPAQTFAAAPGARTYTDEELSAGLPGSLFTTPAAAVPEERETPVLDVTPETSDDAPDYAAASPDAETEITRDLDGLDPAAGPAVITDAHIQNGAALSDEDVTSLAEQLAEAKHEEAQAEDDAVESVAETFVEPAELEELQEALDSEHDEHEDAAEEADAIADEMHDEALAAEASPEHGEEHSEEHSEGHSEDQAEAHGEEEEHAGAHGEEHGEQMGEDHAEGDHAEETHAEFDGSAEPPQPGENRPPTSARVSEQPRARFQRPMRRGGRPQRGGRRGSRPHQAPQHGHPRHEQHRRPQLISEMLKAGEEIIVQIAKEPLGKKGARITSHVALPGRFLVYMPTVDHIGVSRRIGSAEDRSRLRRLVTEAKGTFPGGFIVRTAASEASDEEIRTDVEFLGRTWDTIRATSEQRRAPSLLHRDLNLVQRILRDYLSEDYAAIWLDNEEEFTKVVEFVGRFQPKLVPRVKLYTKDAPIFEEFGIQQELDKALRPKVWLKSGGYIVINHTEALVAIDVNTGKYVGRGSTRLEDTIVKTNLEAVKEIVRQIRLRDLGGIIVCDFIDMEERRNREKVLAALDQALQQDRAPSKALGFNEFGLVCITRKRTKQALERVLCQPCPYCTGSGMVKSIPTICYEIQTEAKKMAADLDAQTVTLRVNPEIAKALKTREASLIEDLEQATRKSIVIQSDPTLHWEQYDIY